MKIKNTKFINNLHFRDSSKSIYNHPQSYEHTKLTTILIKVFLSIVVLVFLQGCSGGCETAEDLMTDEKFITINANPYEGSETVLPARYVNNHIWISTGQQIDPRDLKETRFTVLSNTADLCGKNITGMVSRADVLITKFGYYYNTKIDVKTGDFLTFALNPRKFTINCSGSDPLIAIIDVDKCKKGYYKKGTDEFVEPMEGKDVELDSFVSINSTITSLTKAADVIASATPDFAETISNSEQNLQNIHNTFIPVYMIEALLRHYTLPSLYPKSTIDSLNFSAGNGLIIPGKALTVPEYYEMPMKDKNNKIVSYGYSPFPEIPQADSKFFQYQFASDADIKERSRVDEETKKYWCRTYPNLYTNTSSRGKAPEDGTSPIPGSSPVRYPPINGMLNRTENIDARMINEFCDKYYYLEKGDDKNPGTVTEYDVWKAAPLNAKAVGNTVSGYKKSIFSVMGNKSYIKSTIPETEYKDGKMEETGNTEEKYFIMTNSKFFYGLNAQIAPSRYVSPFLSRVQDRNVNQDYITPTEKSFVSRMDGNGIIQLPLNEPIPVKRDGKLLIGIGSYADLTAHGGENSVVGNANIKVIRSCPLRELYGVFAEDETELNSITKGDPKIFKIPLYRSEVGVVPDTPIAIDEFVIDKNLVPGGRKKWLYLSLLDNGDNFQNNTGSVKLATRIPRDSSQFVTKFINRIFERMMDIMYGERTDPDVANSPREGRHGSGIVRSIYENMIKAPRFQAILRASSILLIVIYGISVLMGLAQFHTGDLIRTVVKFAIVYALLQPFSWKFFTDNFFNLFINGPKYLVRVITTPPSENLNLNSEKYIIGPINDVIQRFTDFAIWKQVISIAFAGPFGWILFFFLLQSCWLFITGSLSAILTYLVSITIVGVFISVAPLFILCLMFKKTSGIFTAWTKVLMVNTLNAVIVFAALVMVGGIASVLINQVFGFGVCTDCVSLYHGPAGINFCLLYGDMPDSYSGALSYEERIALDKSQSTYPSAEGQFFGFPFPFFAFVCFLIMGHVVSNLSLFFSLMAEDLIGVDYGSPTQAANIASAVSENIKSWTGTGKSNIQQEVGKRAKRGAKDKIEVKDADDLDKKKR